MANEFFRFKQFTIHQELCAMKVGTDGVLLGSWVDISKASAILDIGTGTGLVAIMLAQRTDAAIDAIDIDQGACIQATENIIHSPWKGKIAVHHSSLQLYADKAQKTYDLIVTNPPYFENSLKTPDEQRNFARHNDSLSITDILRGVDKLLSSQGRFVIILPYIEAQLLIVEAAMHHLYCNKKLVIKTLPTKKPSRITMEFNRTREKLVEDVLSIYDSESMYTEDYKNLTKDYYLNF
ncbi:MAG TPA: methyltransferase [Bacteroidales bacterium]|nr:methyltransferase [Bacteroidales bacterium]